MDRKKLPGETHLIYHTVNLTTKSLTDIVTVVSVNKDGTINTPDTQRLMLLKTLESISYPTQKDAERQAVKNFLSRPKLFKGTEYFDYAKAFAKEHYPELVI